MAETWNKRCVRNDLRSNVLASMLFYVVLPPVSLAASLFDVLYFVLFSLLISHSSIYSPCQTRPIVRINISYRFL